MTESENMNEVISFLASKYGLRVKRCNVKNDPFPIDAPRSDYLFSFFIPKHIPNPTPERIEQIRQIIFVFFRGLPNFSIEQTEKFDGHWAEISTQNLFHLLTLVDEVMREN